MDRTVVIFGEPVTCVDWFSGSGKGKYGARETQWAEMVAATLEACDAEFRTRYYCEGTANNSTLELLVVRLDGTGTYVHREKSMNLGPWDLHARRPDLIAEDGRVLCTHTLYLKRIQGCGDSGCYDSQTGLYARIDIGDAGYHPCWYEGTVEVYEHRFEPRVYQRACAAGEPVEKVPVMIPGPPPFCFVHKWGRVFGMDEVFVPCPDTNEIGEGGVYAAGTVRLPEA